MNPDDRRQAIIEATLPLVLEYGSHVSTREIASAAGVAEGTIFRAFATKQELLDAVVSYALSTDAIVSGLRVLDGSRPLEAQVADIMTVIHEEFDRTRALSAMLVGSRRRGSRARTAVQGQDAQGQGAHLRTSARSRTGSHERMARIRDAVADALAPYGDELVVDPPTAAGVLFAMVLAGHLPASPPFSPIQSAALAIHGLVKGK